MAKEANPNIRELIASSVAAGARREDIARAAGLSRVHLWRIETARVESSSRAALRLRQVLEEPSLLKRELAAALDTFIHGDERRGRLMLQMLRTLSDLGEVSGSEDPPPRR